VVNTKLGVVQILPGKVGTTHLHTLGRDLALTAGTGGMTGSYTKSSNGDYTISLHGRISNPFIPAIAKATIRYDATIIVSHNGHVSISGSHTAFPAFELYSYTNRKGANIVNGYFPFEYTAMTGLGDSSVPF